ncbi:thiamine pyrophosphate-binding protein [Dictyobacter arantiisoli]|uniref:Putative 2-ketoarginine decarboxylase AruI n=1 Tax=Dictyobacter arantiisoli TaxID=2014874 RepID=A0A5A5TDK6_9CHLR|nr:thiamine pyrophosphate-binding protein [Dictyobacter arantiisoli]GCF09447.1 putative 2-ketoarginine decarboxylase AruI [Dictyobacter arantiisoli]
MTNASNRKHLTGAQAIIATLRAYNVDTIFGIPGVHTLPIYDAIYHEPGLRHILARHEQGAGFMAEGYARISGRPGVVCTITGPGVTNVTTPAASAYADSVPLLVISSALSRATQGLNRGELHEVKDQLGIMQALVGWTRAINYVEEIPEAIHDAFRVMYQGRPRGAYLQIPYDLLLQTADVTIPALDLWERPLPAIEPLAAAVDVLREAQRPLIIAGNGVTASGANQQLLQLAELLQAPVLLGSKSHDVLPTRHPLVIATNDNLPLELDAFIATRDVVLVVGSKLGAERTAGGRLPLPDNLIHIDIDPMEIGHAYRAQVGIVSDAKVALETLFKLLKSYPMERTAPESALADLRETIYEYTLEFQGENLQLLEGVRIALEQMPAETVVVADMTMLGYAAACYLPMRQPRTFIHPSELCTIGSGLPMALGAQLAIPGRPVIALCGDGGFLLNSSELATAVQEKIPVIVVIFNDATFTRVKTDQRTNYDKHYIATDLQAPDYLLLAQAFHAQSMRAETAEALSSAIKKASQHNGPTIIEVPLLPRQWDQRHTAEKQLTTLAQ